MGETKTQWTPFLRQLWVSLGVSLNMASSGLVVGFTPALLHQLRDSTLLPNAAFSWIAAMPGLSLMFGNLMAPPIMDRCGRKIANVATIVPLIVSWVLIYFANHVIVLLLARFLQGLCMGMCTSLGSLLIGEYTSPKNRGAFLMTISLAIAFGVLCVHQSGSYLSWRNTSLVCAAVATFDLFIVINSPESPSWLAEKGRYEDCRKSFRWLRGGDEEDELKRLIEGSILLNETKARLTQARSFEMRIKKKIDYFILTIRKKEFQKPIIIMIHIYIMSQWSGINVFVAYPTELLYKLLSTEFSIPLFMLSIDIHRLVANTIALYVIQKVKRRTIILATVIMNIFALISCACYFYAKTNHYIPSEEYIFGISLVHLHMFSVATGSLPMCFILAGELFPLEYRGFAGGISVFVYSINLFVSVKIIPLLLIYLNLHGTYGLYSAILVYCLLVVWYLLPETKDRTLQDIEDEFRGRPLSPEQLKSVQPLTSGRSLNTDRRCSGPVVA